MFYFLIYRNRYVTRWDSPLPSHSQQISESLDMHCCRFWGSHVHQDLSHSHQQLSHLRNKIVTLHYHLVCSDSPVVTSRCYFLLPLLSFSSILILYTLIIWLCYKGPWYSYYSHNHPWFINKYSVSENSILWKTLPLTTLIHHEADMDNLKEKEKNRLVMWCHPTQECEIISSKLECQS